MKFLMPEKGEMPVCKECKKETFLTYASCIGPCNHLVSVVIHEATRLISDAISRHEWPAERETYPGDNSGGD